MAKKSQMNIEYLNEPEIRLKLGNVIIIKNLMDETFSLEIDGKVKKITAREQEKIKTFLTFRY